MRTLFGIAVVAGALAALAGCGGGQDTPAVDASRQEAQAARPKTRLTVTPASIQLTVEAGAQLTVDLVADYPSRSAKPAYLDVVTGGVHFVSKAGITPLGTGRYAVRLTVAAGLPAGTLTGTVTFRMCSEIPCVNVLADGTVLVPYTLVVKPGTATLPDWQGFQGNAGHTGHVPVTLDPAKFRWAWEWRRTTAGVLGFINAPVTEGGKVFVTDDEYFGSITSLYALNEADGSLAWRQDFINAPALNPPAVANGIVYAATTGHADTALWAFRASDGGLLFRSAFDGQWPHVLAPTIRDGRVYTNGGYYGGGVYAFDATSGAARWSQFAGDNDMSTPAVDASRVYHYSGTSLEVYSVLDGQLVASIPDPQVFGSGYSSHSAPVLGSADHIITFSGDAFSGRASSSVEHYDSRPLANFSLAERALRWRTSNAYLTQPAVARGVVYAGRNAPKSFDALSEATGEILWSWPGAGTEQGFHRNVVVTDNLVFVSTDTAVHAISLATRQSVWSYPAPGMLAISAQGTLYIAEGATEPTGRLIAIRLR